MICEEPEISPADRPTVSVVTPSYQQSQYLESALRSVLDQRHAGLEYVVVDGGSTDGSTAIVEKYAHRLAHWVSEPDDGHYDAVDKGFARTSGDIMCWLNSDDMHLPWTLDVVADIFEQHPQVEWLTTRFPMYWDRAGRAVHCAAMTTVSSAAFLRGQYLPGGPWPASGWIQQESTFWRRSLWKRAGGQVSGAYRLAGDFDLWARFSQLSVLHAVEVPLAGFRRHAEQQTAQHLVSYRDEAVRSLRSHGGRLPSGAAVRHIGRAAVTRLPRSVRARWPGSLGTPIVRFDDAAARWRLGVDY